ncbi:unnamed protein product [Scytosiphon promiscuus]
MALRKSLAGVGAASTAISGAAYYYRPDPSGELLESRRTKSPGRNDRPQDRCDDATEPEPVLLQAARSAVMTPVAVLSRVVLFGLNNTRLVEDERHARLVDFVRKRPEGEPLLTVSNHASTLDDPAVMSVLLPWDVVLRPKLMRWSVCSQEICFETPAIASFFGAGKVLPLERGAGLDQKLLLNFSRKLAAGEWCHIFPEGKTVQQTGKIGSRLPPASEKLGLLKWGVGRMIAHAPRTPRVVPFFHTGMQNLVSEDPVSKDVLPKQPQSFNDITIRVGDAVEVKDLLAEHEDAHGPLWKYSAGATNGGADDERKWASHSSADLLLYSAITRRIQAALQALEAEVRSCHKPAKRRRISVSPALVLACLLGVCLLGVRLLDADCVL